MRKRIMHDHHDGEYLRRLLEGAGTADALLAAREHVAGCDACRSSFSIRRLATSDGPFETTLAHVEDEELFAFVDGTLDPAARQAVREHLEECSLCSAREADLTVLREQPPQSRFRARVMYALAAAACMTVVFLVVRGVPSAGQDARPAPARVSIAAPVPPRYGRHDWDELTRAALATGTVVVPSDLVSRRPAITMATRSVAHERDPQRFAPDGVVVEDRQPALSWPEQDTKEYVVRVFLGGREVAKSPVVSQPHWTVEPPLARGETYDWQVETPPASGRVIPASPAAPPSFRVLSARDAEDLAAARAQFPGEPLLLGCLYARAGLVAEAQMQFREFARLHPESAAAQRLAAQFPG
jgi:Putative zinc-finger